MISMFRSITGLLLGLALAIYGIVHICLHYPGSAPFAALAGNLLALSAVLLFALGLLAIVAGVGVAVTSSRRLSRQWRQLKHLTERRREFVHDDDDYAMSDRSWAGGHR